MAPNIGQNNANYGDGLSMTNDIAVGGGGGVGGGGSGLSGMDDDNYEETETLMSEQAMKPAVRPPAQFFMGKPHKMQNRSEPSIMESGCVNDLFCFPTVRPFRIFG